MKYGKDLLAIEWRIKLLQHIVIILVCLAKERLKRESVLSTCKIMKDLITHKTRLEIL